MPRYKFGNISFKYRVERSSRRKSVAIIVDPLKGVVIKAPQDASKEKIQAILRRKAPWVQRKLRDIERVACPPPDREYVSGESYQYLGRHYRLKVLRKTVDPPIKMDRGRMTVSIPNGLKGKKKAFHIRDLLEKWYLSHAQDKISERVTFYASKLDVEPSEIIIKHQAKRWGSCTSKGVLNFNWRIIMAPMSIVDYVVVHELCHLKYPDHQPKYWQNLSAVMPDYEKRREWLRINGPSLTL